MTSYTQGGKIVFGHDIICTLLFQVTKQQLVVALMSQSTMHTPRGRIPPQKKKQNKINGTRNTIRSFPFDSSPFSPGVRNVRSHCSTTAALLTNNAFLISKQFLFLLLLPILLQLLNPNGITTQAQKTEKFGKCRLGG